MNVMDRDYQSPPPHPTRRIQIARTLELVVWTLWGLTLISIIIVTILRHYQRTPIIAIDAFLLLPLVNLAGFVTGFVGTALDSKACFIAALAHLVAVGIWFASLFV
jgi:hypothetical protein